MREIPIGQPEAGHGPGALSQVAMRWQGAGKAVWCHQAVGLIALGVWTERRTGYGEDAEPLFIHHGPTSDGVIGVFDGAGGAGAATVCTSRDGLPRSSAWVGARMARQGVHSWFLERLVTRAEFDAESLRRHIAGLLSGARPSRRHKIHGSMVRDFPSTMAVICFRMDRDKIECRTMWSGDSRAYLLTPVGGLQVLTRDHTVATDALEQLLTGPPMTNMLCGDRPFAIETHVNLLEAPCVLLCATDGFFGYVDTPSDFECRLLGTLATARDPQDWAEQLAEQVSVYSADDASMCVTAMGFADFDDLQMCFHPRGPALQSFYAADANEADHDPPASRRRERVWHRYRSGYERLMPSSPEGCL